MEQDKEKLSSHYTEGCHNDDAMMYMSYITGCFMPGTSAQGRSFCIPDAEEFNSLQRSKASVISNRL